MELFAWVLDLADGHLREIERQREDAEERGALREEFPMLREVFSAGMRLVDDLFARAREAGIPAEDLSLLGAV